MTTLDELLDAALPLNRKERYYTGTVLPALVCAGDMAHLARLGPLLGLDKLDIRADPQDATVVFFTEYGMSESAVGKARDRFAGLPTTRDTPDVVILVTEPSPVLIALEAKLYDRPSRPEMLDQIARQQGLLVPLVERLAWWLGTETVRLAHAALLPERLAQSLGQLPVPTITWEQVRDTYAGVAPAYFQAMLTTALARYDDLVSKWTGYQDNELPGEVLVERWQAGDGTYPWMGRRGGLLGAALAADAAGGAWRETVYQCRREQLPGNPNWFAVADFIAVLVKQGQLPAQAAAIDAAQV